MNQALHEIAKMAQSFPLKEWEAAKRAKQIERERVELGYSLREFAKAAWHVLEPTTPLKWGWGLDAICDHLEAVSRGDIQRLLMNVPPGSMKSLLTGVIFPAWEWGPKGMPSMRYLGTSHKQDLAVRDNMKCRRLIQSQWYQDRWPTILTGDQNAKTKFENDKTGFREAMAFTSMTGSRGDRVILDDPLSVDDAYSEAALDAAERTFLEALPTRVNNSDSAIIVIMQRLHERDTSGVILKLDLGYEHLCIPMRYEAARKCVTSIGFADPRTKEGELFFPDRFSEHEVKALEKSLGQYAAAGQLQQRPAPAEGGIVKAEWYRLWPSNKPLPQLTYVVQSYDTAFTDKTENDPTAMSCWGVFKDEKIGWGVLLLDCWSDHLQYPDLRRKMVKEYGEVYGDAEAKVDVVLIEEKGSGIALAQDLSRAGVPVRRYNPGRADKVQRLHAVTHLLEAGKVWVPESRERKDDVTDWSWDLIKQSLTFPNAEHDDYVDTMTQCLALLRDQAWIYPDEDVDLDALPTERKARENPYGS